MSQQPTRADDTEYSGLPEADDYEPDAMGTIETRAGQPEQEWPQFGLEAVPIQYKSYTQEDWQDTGRRVIQRNGEFVADVSADYKLLPNERVVDVANEVARELDAGPFHEFDGDWFITLDDHVFQDSARRRVHAVYAWDQGTIGDDSMEYGFGVHNSIDGSQRFSVGLFTFRHACANMVFMGAGGHAEQMALGVESEREILSRLDQAHTGGLEVDREALKASIKGTLTLIDDVDATYEKWLSESLTAEDVRDVVQRPSLAQRDLPEWMAEIPDIVEEVYADEFEEDEEMPWERQAEVIEAEIPEGTTVWETYNDLTQAIWHRGESSDNTRRRKMKGLHRVFEPASEGENDIPLR